MERNYEIHNKEMLAVVRCLEAWRDFLEGTVVKFKIWTDHKNLEYFMKVQKLNRRQARWVLYLSRFDFTLKHVLGSKMGKANNLSRRLDWEVGVEKDDKDETLIKLEWLEVKKTEAVCYDLANWLSHYFFSFPFIFKYCFSFLFLFFNL